MYDEFEVNKGTPNFFAEFISLVVCIVFVVLAFC